MEQQFWIVMHGERVHRPVALVLGTVEAAVGTMENIYTSLRPSLVWGAYRLFVSDFMSGTIVAEGALIPAPESWMDDSMYDPLVEHVYTKFYGLNTVLTRVDTITLRGRQPYYVIGPAL